MIDGMDGTGKVGRCSGWWVAEDEVDQDGSRGIVWRRQAQIDGTAPLKIRVRLIFIVGTRYEGLFGSSDRERAVENKRLREIK
mgnify:CR=1 FL=1